MAVRNQRANCPATSQYIVAAMFIMRTMVDERRNQINMPRLDAYGIGVGLRCIGRYVNFTQGVVG